MYNIARVTELERRKQLRENVPCLTLFHTPELYQITWAVKCHLTVSRLGFCGQLRHELSLPDKITSIPLEKLKLRLTVEFPSRCIFCDHVQPI